MAKKPDKSRAFEARGLTCERGGRVLFKDLSLALNPSDVLIVRGPNGSGKTSLLRLLAGLLTPDEGDFRWQGEQHRDARTLVAGAVHYLGHAHGLKPFLTVAENLSLWAKLYGGGGGIEKAADKTGVGNLLGIPVKYLSEGQKKRVNLARFLSVPLPLWIMDEPTAALDAGGRGLVADMVAAHGKEGGITVLAAHQDMKIKAAKTLTLGGGKTRWGR